MLIEKKLLVLLCILISTFCNAASVIPETSYDSLFQEGVKDYDSKDFLNCAIKMESFKDVMTNFSPASKSKINYYRVLCNGKIGYYNYTLPLIKEISRSDLDSEQKNTLENFKKEMQFQVFKIGYLSAKKQDYLSCATQMESIKDPSDLFTRKAKNRILFYRVFCNTEIGYKAFSAELFEDVSVEELTENEKIIFIRLKEVLKKELEVQKKIFTYLTLYGGSLSFSPQITKSKAKLYGISSSFVPAIGGWDFNIAVEKVDLTLVNSANNYTQTQANFSFGKNFLNNFSIRPFFTSITTSNSAGTDGGNEGSVMGVMGSYINSLTSKISLEYDYSLYPSFSIGKTTSKQYVVSWDKTLATKDTYTVASKILIESVQPQSSVMTDPNTGFILKSHYERIALDLNFYFASYQLGFNGWTGSEALGTRSLGTMVFNALEERSQGIGANIKFDLKPSTTSCKLSYSSETILTTSSSTIKASTLVGALTFVF